MESGKLVDGGEIDGVGVGGEEELGTVEKQGDVFALEALEHLGGQRKHLYGRRLGGCGRKVEERGLIA